MGNTFSPELSIIFKLYQHMPLSLQSEGEIPIPNLMLSLPFLMEFEEL